VNSSSGKRISHETPVLSLDVTMGRLFTLLLSFSSVRHVRAGKAEEKVVA
jgi:hypothetical protein